MIISRQLAELMQGAAGVHSAPGEGSTFWFTARVRRAPGPLDVSADAPTPLPGTGGRGPGLRAPSRSSSTKSWAAAAQEGLIQLRAMQTLLGGPSTPGKPLRP